MDGKISNFDQIASLRRYKFTEGTEEGIEVIECNNGRIRFLLNVSKCLDIMQLYYEGMNVSFVSKNGFTKREISFVKRFEGGMLYTCGLDSLGAREGYDLHGSIHNTPAKIIKAKCDKDGIRVEALIKDTSLFGSNLILKRCIFTLLESNDVEIIDEIVNLGYKSENYCLLYHVNLGYPMLSDGAIVEASIKNCESRNKWSEQNISSMFMISDAVPNQEEMCYFLKLNTPSVSLINKKINKKFTITYSQNTLPCFIQWKSMASGDYALGLEPCTTFLDDRFEYKKIQPNESIKFEIKFTINNIK